MKKCTLIRRKQKKHKRAELNTSKRENSAIYWGKSQRRNHGWHGAANQGHVEWQQGQRTRGRDRERDDQKVCPWKKSTPERGAFRNDSWARWNPPISWQVVKLVFLKKPDAAPTKGIRSYQAIALDIRVCKLHLITRGKGKGTKMFEEKPAYGWSGRDKLPTPSSFDDEFTAKTLGVARRKECGDETLRSGKTNDVHGKLGHQDGLRWSETETCGQDLERSCITDGLIAALLREMSGLCGKATFERVESYFSFNRCLRQGSVEAPCLWQKMATLILTSVEEEWMKKSEGVLLDVEGEGVHQIQGVPPK